MVLTGQHRADVLRSVSHPSARPSDGCARAMDPGKGAMTSFLIIDAHPLFREALGNAVRLALPEARILEAVSIEDALRGLSVERGIDLALLDLSLPDATGFSGFLRLRETHPRLPVAIVSSEEDQQVV